MRKIFLIIVLAINCFAFSQEDKTVTLTVSAQGQTISEAKQNALRDAIEQAFGTFISSNTEILNDELVKDEIVSVSNGNIQDYEVISEVQLPNGYYATTLKARVSVTKLTSFVESKGVSVEFKGGVFASNILIQELHKKNELKAINSIVPVLKEISRESFNYSINAENPYLKNDSWRIPISVDVSVNSNFMNIPALLENTVKSLSMSSTEVENYTKLNIPVFPVTLLTLNAKGFYYLRNAKSVFQIIDFIYSLNSVIVDFKISNGIKRKHLSDYRVPKYFDTEESRFESSAIVKDDKFRIILASGCSGGLGIMPASLFHNARGSDSCSEEINFNYKNIYHGQKEPNSHIWPINKQVEEIDIQRIVSDYSMKKSNNYYLPEGRKSWDKTISHLYTLKKKSNWYIRDLLKQTKRDYYPGKDINNRVLGLVISFISVKPKSVVVQFKMNDIATISEIKNITQYEIKKD